MTDGARAPRVDAVLVNYNGWRDTIECLESLLRSRHDAFGIVVVDNASTNDSADRIAAWARAEGGPPRRFLELAAEALQAGEVPGAAELGRGAPEVVLIRSGRNGGFGAGNNVGFRYLERRGGADLVWLVNNDTVVTPEAMSQLAKVAWERNAIVGGALYYYHEPRRLQVLGGSHVNRWTGLVAPELRDPAARLDYVNGACLMMRMDTLRAIGHFDEKIFLYAEELDLCLRAGRLGVPCLGTNAVLLHKHGGSSQSQDDSFAWGHALRNKPYVLKKNWGYGLWLPVYLASVLLFTLGIGASAGKKKAARALVRSWFSTRR